MANFETNHSCTLSEVNKVKENIIANGVEVPVNTPTSKYGEKINEVYDKGCMELEPYAIDNLAVANKLSSNGSFISINDADEKGKVECKVKSENEWNNLYIKPHQTGGGLEIKDITESSLTISIIDPNYHSNGVTYGNGLLKEICSNLQIGHTYVLSANTNSQINTLIYLGTAGISWKFGESLMITQEMLDSGVSLYGMNITNGEPAQDCIISNIQIEEVTDNTPTPWTPYIPDLTATKVEVYGKNLVDISQGIGNIYNRRSLSYNNGIYRMETFEKSRFSEWINVNLPSGNCNLTWDVLKTSNPYKQMAMEIKFSDNTSISQTLWNSYPKLKLHYNKKIVQFRFYFSSWDMPNFIEFKNFMISKSDSDYESYIPPHTYTPLPDGTVENVQLNRLNNTVMSDTEGVNIDLKYKGDTKTVADKAIADAMAIALEV